MTSDFPNSFHPGMDNIGFTSKQMLPNKQKKFLHKVLSSKFSPLPMSRKMHQCPIILGRLQAINT